MTSGGLWLHYCHVALCPNDMNGAVITSAHQMTRPVLWDAHPALPAHAFTPNPRHAQQAQQYTANLSGLGRFVAAILPRGALSK